MEHTGKGMFIVENFLCCLSLRTGIMFTLWLTFLYLLFLSIICLVKIRVLVLPFILFITGAFISGRALWYLPIPGKNYSATSVNAKSTIHFAYYQGFFALLGIPFFAVFCYNIASYYRREEYYISAFLVITLFTAWQLHNVAVSYSYFLAITKYNGNNGSISNNFNSATNTENGQVNVPFNVEPLYSECASVSQSTVNNETYDIIHSSNTSKQSNTNLARGGLRTDVR